MEANYAKSNQVVGGAGGNHLGGLVLDVLPLAVIRSGDSGGALVGDGGLLGGSISKGGVRSREGREITIVT